jgi:acetyl esterase/lipase
MTSVPTLHDGEQIVYFQAGGDWCYLWTPETFRAGTPVPVLIHHHGAGGYVRDGGADWFEVDQKVGYLKAIMQATGCAVASSHACGDHWGNACATQANGALYEALLASGHMDASRVGLMGGGLGGALVWNTVLGPLAGKVKTAAVLQAVASLEDIIRDHKFKAPLLEAFGLPVDLDDDAATAAVAAQDPLPRLQRLPAGAPLPRTAIYHGGQDNNVLPEANAVALADALRRAGADVTLEIFPEVDHFVYEMGQPIQDRLAAFFGAAL